jgi:hypothetical protein
VTTKLVKALADPRRVVGARDPGEGRRPGFTVAPIGGRPTEFETALTVAWSSGVLWLHACRREPQSLIFPLTAGRALPRGHLQVCGRRRDHISVNALKTQAEVRIVAGATQSRPSLAAALRSGAQSTRRRAEGPWRNRTVVLGMSDDEYLNMPGWGRPSSGLCGRACRVSGAGLDLR